MNEQICFFALKRSLYSRSFFGRIYGALICLWFYLTFAYPKIRRHLWIFPNLFHKRQINERKYFHSYVYVNKVQLFFPGITGEYSTQQMYGSVKQTFSSQFYYWASLVPSYHRPSQLKVPEQYPKKITIFWPWKKVYCTFGLFCKQEESYRHYQKLIVFLVCSQYTISF